MTIRRRKKQFKIIILGIKQSEIKKNHVKWKKREGRYLIIAKKEEGGWEIEIERRGCIWVEKQRDEKEEERDENDL